MNLNQNISIYYSGRHQLFSVHYFTSLYGNTAGLSYRSGCPPQNDIPGPILHLSTTASVQRDGRPSFKRNETKREWNMFIGTYWMKNQRRLHQVFCGKQINWTNPDNVPSNGTRSTLPLIYLFGVSSARTPPPWNSSFNGSSCLGRYQ